MIDLPERQRLILKEIVDRYIRFHEPVSSRMILEDYGLEVSSATVRNDMNDLEEAGFIAKPYSSSGRVPSKLGYQFFVEWLLDLSELSREERVEIVEAYEMLFRRNIVIDDDLTRRTGHKRRQCGRINGVMVNDHVAGLRGIGLQGLAQRPHRIGHMILIDKDLRLHAALAQQVLQNACLH